MRWTANKVREEFLKFFEERGHKRVKSSSLIPYRDPTLLFTNAGMNQFKPYFLGEEEPPFKRATSCQKCLRAGGKHNDLDNVGFTTRHHTFFEMLGNFSFGDYFKKEAIKWAWELITEVFGLPKDKLYVSVYEEDEEAYQIWHNEIGLSPDRILKYGKEDNFWQMADTGPAGPCSEIHFKTDDEELLELWNLVFMQYNLLPDGKVESLPKKNIDTGMGLERILRVLQGVDSNYHTDLFMPIIEEFERISGVKYKKDEEGIPHRVVADHIRALTFAISDGVYPSNVGRGYVIRRILRRAHIFARKFEVSKPFLYSLVPVVVEIMKDAYPEIVSNKTEIEFIIKSEEERFLNTLAKNIIYLEDVIKKTLDKGYKQIDGKDVFKLYDTYGIPLDLVEDYAKNYNLTIDYDGFKKSFEIQREKTRKKVGFEIKKWDEEINDGSIFVGYDKLEDEGTVIKKRIDGKKIEIVLDKTPFYAEAGGQVGDKGVLKGKDFEIKVEDTQWSGKNIVHIGKIVKGSPENVKCGEKVKAIVDKEWRVKITHAHTGTHLLHRALQLVLGEHAKQEGSLVEPDRLRFDFRHFKKVTEDELLEIERIVNQKITENLEVLTYWKSYKEAIEEGAIALFGEKYGEKVRVVQIGDFSKELCGGTHCKRTGDIGFFKIIKEESVSAGIRRITAYTGLKAFEYVKNLEKNIFKISEKLKTEPSKLLNKFDKMLEEFEEIRKKYEKFRDKWANAVSYELIENVEILNGKNVILKDFEGIDLEDLRRVSDYIFERLEKGVVFLASRYKGRVNVFCRVEGYDDISAVELVKLFGGVVGGGGGGDKRRAQGGGRWGEKIKEGFQLIKNKLQHN